MVHVGVEEVGNDGIDLGVELGVAEWGSVVREKVIVAGFSDDGRENLSGRIVKITGEFVGDGVVEVGLGVAGDGNESRFVAKLKDHFE